MWKNKRDFLTHLNTDYILKEIGKMLKPEDIDEVSYNLAKGCSEESSVVVVKMPSGTVIIDCSHSEENHGVISTESGLALSQDAIAGLEDLEYLFIPKGSHNKNDKSKS
jgi:hypothetical protein